MNIRVAGRRAAAVAVVLLFGAMSTPAAGSVERPARADTKAATPLSATGTVYFGNCAAHAVVLHLSIARAVAAVSQPVAVRAVVVNVGSLPCTYGGSPGHNQLIGPCGAMSLQVFNDRGQVVWPGPVVVNCPMIGIATLAPGARIDASGTWPGLVVTRSSSTPAPPGTYRLVVDRRVSLTVAVQ